MRLNPTSLSIIKRLLNGKNNRPLRSILRRTEAADLASFFANLNLRESKLFVQALMETRQIVDVLLEVPEQQLEILFKKIEASKLVQILELAAVEDACYLLRLIDNQDEVLSQLSDEKRQKCKLWLNYPEDSAGRIMSTSFFAIPVHLNAKEALEHLRSHSEDTSFYYVYCVDESGILLGVASLRELAMAPEDKALVELIKQDIISVQTDTSEIEVAQLVERYNFIAIPVLNKNRKLMGVISVDEVVDILQEQATADIYASAGLQEDDRVYSPAKFSIKNRLPWMQLNLVLAAYVSYIVSLFEATMKEIIILATLNNIVAGMGGNTAIQTLTVVTRGIALGDFLYISTWRAIFKEAIVGSFNGIITGIAAGIMVYFWKDNSMVAVVICISMILNSFVASGLGASIPLALKRFGWDPTAGAGVLVTMLTDSFGFFSFLGIASLGLKYVS